MLSSVFESFPTYIDIFYFLRNIYVCVCVCIVRKKKLERSVAFIRDSVRNKIRKGSLTWVTPC